MKCLFLAFVLISMSTFTWAFPWSSSSCGEGDSWCRDGNNGYSAFSSWDSLPSTGYGSPYQKHTHVPVEHILPRPHILSGFLGLAGNISDMIGIIIGAESKKNALLQLQSEFGLSRLQALGILDLPLDQLTEDGLDLLKKEYRTYVQ